MNILIDLQSCQSGSSKGGIGRYSADITKALIQVGDQHDFSILLNSSLPYQNEIRYLLKDLIPSDRFHIFSIPENIAELYDTPAKTRAAELVREKFISDLNPDVLIICSLFEGLGDNVASSIGHIFPKEQTVVILYDLIPYVEREKYLTNHILINHYMNKIEELRKAELYLAISDYSKLEAINLLSLNPNKVTNISSASSANFSKLNISVDEKDDLKSKYKIKDEFIMFTGSYDSRKNHHSLIKAYALLQEKIRNKYQLVLVGRGHQSIYDDLIKTGSEHGVQKNQIVFLDNVGDSDLIKLYNIATLFVFPSLREGFGLPVLESMLCGCPTIGSNTTCIPEVIQIEKAMFDPNKPDEIAQKIEYFINNPNERELLVSEQSKIAKQFSWESSAQKALNFIEKNININDVNHPSEEVISNALTQKVEKITLAHPKDLNRDFLYECAVSVTKNEFACPKYKDLITKPKIGWVSSWNTKCGIAAYSNYILENFKNQSVHIFANHDESIVKDDDNVTRSWQAGETDTLEALESEIYLHQIDFVMIQFNYGFFNFEFLKKFIRSLKDNGVFVGITLHSTIDPPADIYNKPLKSLADELQKLDLIFVHSIDDVNRLSQMDLCKNVFLLNQGFIDYAESEALPLGVNSIATFGYFLPHKGLDVVLEATKILKDRGIHLKLSMINAEYPAEVSSNLIAEAKEYIHCNELSEQVELITQYLPIEDSINHLRSAQLIIFAYQNTGESSSAAVRMAISSGRLVLVTPLDIFKDVEDSVEKFKGYDALTIANDLQEYIVKFHHRDENLVRKLNFANKSKSINSWQTIASYIKNQINFISNTS